MSLLDEASRYTTSAIEHVVRRRFPAGIAEDAVQNALNKLAVDLKEPGFVSPVNTKAYLFSQAVKEAYNLIRDDRRAGATSGGVGGRRAPKRVAMVAAENVSPEDIVGEDDLNGHERDPDWSNRATEREGIRAEFLKAVARIESGLSPNDRTALEHEIDRTSPLDPAQRKRLSRARHKAQKALSRIGVWHSFPVPLQSWRRTRPPKR